MNLRRRMMMGTEKEKMTEWKTLFEEELAEDKNITLSGLDCTEVEAYVISDGWGSENKIYLTSNSSDNIYGDPRISADVKTTSFIMKLKLKVITQYLWEMSTICIPYYAASNYSNEAKTYGHAYLNTVIDKEKITDISLAANNGSLVSGTKVFIRGK